MNRAFTKAPLGTLAAWEALAVDPTLTKKEHQDAREGETKLTYRKRKQQREWLQDQASMKRFLDMEAMACNGRNDAWVDEPRRPVRSR